MAGLIFSAYAVTTFYYASTYPSLVAFPTPPDGSTGYVSQGGNWYYYSYSRGYVWVQGQQLTVGTSTYTPTSTFTPTPTSTWTSTFTFVPTPVWVSVIGNQTPSSSGQVSANYLWACPQTAVYSMSITQLNIYVTGGTWDYCYGRL